MTTTLQTTDFDFYGDSLIAIKDNTSNEIYTAITHVLRGIGFNPKQIEHQQNKILNDELLKSHTQKFSGVDLNMPSINEIWCISSKKLPIALAKIHITPKMRRDQPTLSEKLLRYQDKCADVLASVFMDKSYPSDINLQPLLDAIASLTVAVTSMQQDLQILIHSSSAHRQLPRKRYFSRWTNKMMPKYQLLMDYLHVDRKELYHNLFMELQNLYPDIDLAQAQDDFCFENNIDSCFTMDVIEHTKSLRDIFEHMVDSILSQYGLSPNVPAANINKTIFH